MSYRALYREYRPQTFDEVVGQQFIVKTLQNAIANNRIAHAYLFCGPRGTGKTTIAKLIAKALNCENDNKPCGKCEHCVSIMNGTYPDVVEIDAASNNGVEEVRNLIEKVKYAPLEGKYKVYIIDEVHMMTDSAFNALLKTLEEPPAHVVFILATTEAHKVLPTIVSRCQRFDFSKVSNEDIKVKILEILHRENITCDPTVPSLIADLADGGVRDALGILDQTISYAGNNLKDEDVRKVFGVLSNQELINFLSNVNGKKVLDTLELLDSYDKRGIDLIRLNNYLIDALKDYIVYSKTYSVSSLKLLKENDAKELMKFMDSTKAFKLIDILMDSSLNFKKVSSIRSYFELVVLKLCDVESTVVENKNAENNLKQGNNNVQQPTKDIKELEETFYDDIVNAPEEETVIEEPVAEQIIEEPKQEVQEEKKVEVQEQPKIETIPVEEIEPVKQAEITDSMIIDYLCSCDKTTKAQISNIWPSISRYIQHNELGEAAKALRDTSVVGAGEHCLVVITDYQHQADAINSYNLYFECRKLLKEIYSRDFYLIAITNDRFESAKIIYRQKMGSNMLPVNPTLSDLYSKDQVKVMKNNDTMKDETIVKGKELFGDLFEVKK